MRAYEVEFFFRNRHSAVRAYKVRLFSRNWHSVVRAYKVMLFLFETSTARCGRIRLGFYFRDKGPAVLADRVRCFFGTGTAQCRRISLGFFI